jgi:hypothetical protein
VNVDIHHGRGSQVLDQDDIENGRRARRRREQLPVARAVFDPKAREGGILEFGDDRPALARDLRAAEPVLILEHRYET